MVNATKVVDLQTVKSVHLWSLGILMEVVSIVVYEEVAMHHYSPWLWLEVSAVLCNSILFCVIARHRWQLPSYESFLGQAGLIGMVFYAGANADIVIHALWLLPRS